MNCPICGNKVPLDFTQKVIWTSYGEEVCCADHSEEQIQNYLNGNGNCPYFRPEAGNIKSGTCQGMKGTPYVSCQGKLHFCCR